MFNYCRAPTQLKRSSIETEPQVCCPLCETPGKRVYDDLRDKLFGAPGIWCFSECPHCGALWLSPRPTEGTVGEAYRNYYTHGYTSFAGRLGNAVITRVARERAALVYGFGRSTWGVGFLSSLAARFYPGLADHADTLIRHLPVSTVGAGARILDVGCGDGSGVEFLNSIGWRASGIEIDPMAVQAAKAKGLDVIQGDLKSAEFADESFDAVTSSHVLEHLHDARAFLAESRRILKAGGVLITTTPNARSELLSLHGRNWRGLEPPRHIVLFNADNLAKLAQDVGMSDIQVKRTAHLASFMHIASVVIAMDGRPMTLSRKARVWLESKLIESRMTRDVRRGQAEGAELTLIALK